MIHKSIWFLWLAAPILIWILDRLRTRRLWPGLLFVISLVTGYASFIVYLFALEGHVHSELYKHDVDGDGSFSESELTPEAELAMENYADDTGRLFAPVFAFPITLIWNMIVLSSLYVVAWVVSAIRGIHANPYATSDAG